MIWKIQTDHIERLCVWYLEFEIEISNHKDNDNRSKETELTGDI